MKRSIWMWTLGIYACAGCFLIVNGSPALVTLLYFFGVMLAVSLSPLGRELGLVFPASGWAGVALDLVRSLLFFALLALWAFVVARFLPDTYFGVAIACVVGLPLVVMAAYYFGRIFRLGRR